MVFPLLPDRERSVVSALSQCTSGQDIAQQRLFCARSTCLAFRELASVFLSRAAARPLHPLTNKVLEDENALDGSKADDIKNTRSSIEAMTSYDSFRALLKYYFMISNSEGTIFSGLVTLGLLTGFLWLLMSPVKF